MLPIGAYSMGEEKKAEEPTQALVNRGMYQPASALRQYDDEAAHLIRVLTEHEIFLNILRQEFRGEQLYQDPSGERYWVQVDKPTFIKLDKNDLPLKQYNPKTKQLEYVPNDDAINAVIQVLKSCGLNPIAPLTALDENEIRADLYEMESKLAVLLTNKRKKWGIDKAEYPVVLGNLKVLIKDARYRAKDGIVLKALRTITQRVEQATENQKPKTIGERITSPFR